MNTVPGPVHHHKKTAVQLENALALLDDKLASLDSKIEIKAIGGFALMKHGIREDDRAYTVDIDSVTRDYSRHVVNAIAEVGRENELDEDWLNNYNVIDNDPEQVEQMIQARWIPQQTSLQNITLSIADVPTLTRSKIIAAADAEFSGREQDQPDLFALVRKQGIQNVSQFRQRYPDPWDEYTPAYEDVAARFRHEYQQRFPQLSKPADQPKTANDFQDDFAF